MPEYDVIPLGATVLVNSALGPENKICHVIGIELNKRTGQVLYELGYFHQRPWPLHLWLKKQKLHHFIGGHGLQVLSTTTEPVTGS
ncbi:hypothetical protein [Enteractinococcus helveticum]|uniref:Uncharacterized protein n=1 Tax=Enteractinococcus helveticum TaxID=1837282 RepID=A0A1B7LYJ7_9MICC|nr:hypothetical protein [Enteractinococcus helveticum]OAV60470.1 hypothetical protein A6F49_10870 [Enteractinococcus helveticum]